MIRILFKTAALFGAFLPAFAGQSLVLSPGLISTSVTDPNQPAGQSWRVEFQLHDWGTPNVTVADIWEFNGIGATASLISSNALYLSFQSKRDSTVGSVCSLTLTAYRDVLVRYQRDYSKKRYVCELWNYDGTGYQQSAVAITHTNDWPYDGGKFGGPSTSAKLGFFRIFRTVLPDGSMPPATAAVGDITNFKFDGNTRDDSGNKHDMSISGATYVQTPDQLPVALIKTDGAPFWSNAVSFRAGYPAVLDATSSFSLADGNSGVTCQWRQLSGPTNVKWSNATTAKPTISGLIFGDYRFQLIATDASGKSTTASLDVGAVATDDNGVVIQGNPAADLIFGPMIALGKNPWQYQDYIALRSAAVRSAYFSTISPPSWVNTLPGTISFDPFYNTTPRQTTLDGSIGPHDTTIVLADASRLDWSVLPTIIAVGFRADAMEEIRICNASGNILTVCYDGRGWRQGLYNEVTAPQAWSSTTQVAQWKTTGTGTQFLTDFCPAGPGEEGQITYSAGTVSVTPDSASITGVTTQWTDSAMTGLRIRISGHHGGTPFAFFAGIAAVNSATSIKLTRPYPATADAESGLTYAILRPGRMISRGWLRSDGSAGQQLSSVSSCESDTQMYHYTVDGIANDNTGRQTGRPYSWDASAWVTDTGPNFYDEVLAYYAGYYRSGLNLFLSNARALGDYWVKNPELDEGYFGVPPRRASMTGVVTAAVLDGRSENWRTIRKMANNAIIGPFSGGAILSSCDTDVREDAYGLSWLALAAMFDPIDTGSPTTPNQRSYWKAELEEAYKRDAGCVSSGGEFSEPFFAGNFPGISLTHGSTNATGAAIPQSICATAATGTVTLTHGSASATGTGFIPGGGPGGSNWIVIRGTHDGGGYYLFYANYTYADPTHLTLLGTDFVVNPWPGDSGTFSYTIENDNYQYLSFAAGQSDYTNLNRFYTCTWNSPTSITLDRGWEGAPGKYVGSRNIYNGVGSTVFHNGIKTLAMKYASLGASGTTATNYTAMANRTANWIISTGFDQISGGLYYALDFYNCLPVTPNRLACSYGVGTEEPARTLNGEAQNALSVAYEANPTPTNLAFGDKFYGAQWGKPGYGNPPYSDGIYLNSLDSDGTFSYKWVGFLFGIGMSHQWPAVRLGGRQPAIPASYPISFDLSTVPDAVSAEVIVTEPSGAVSTFTCASSPCQIQIDARQGTPWYQIAYLDYRKRVRSQSDPTLLELK